MKFRPDPSRLSHIRTVQRCFVTALYQWQRKGRGSACTVCQPNKNIFL